MFNFSLEKVFAALIDVFHHADCVGGLTELVSLSDIPAKLGTQWAHKAKILGRELVIPNECNVFEATTSSVGTPKYLLSPRRRSGWRQYTATQNSPGPLRLKPSPSSRPRTNAVMSISHFQGCGDRPFLCHLQLLLRCDARSPEWHAHAGLLRYFHADQRRAVHQLRKLCFLLPVRGALHRGRNLSGGRSKVHGLRSLCH